MTEKEKGPSKSQLAKQAALSLKSRPALCSLLCKKLEKKSTPIRNLNNFCQLFQNQILDFGYYFPDSKKMLFLPALRNQFQEITGKDLAEELSKPRQPSTLVKPNLGDLIFLDRRIDELAKKCREIIRKNFKTYEECLEEYVRNETQKSNLDPSHFPTPPPSKRPRKRINLLRYSQETQSLP